MAGEIGNGGGGEGSGGRTTNGPRNMVPPSYYRTPYFPYAGLDAQLQDALGLAGRGAGGFTGMASPLMQSIRNAPANLGGGLLGMTAYSRGKSYTPNPYQAPTMPPTGSPMPREGAPVPTGTPTGRGGAPIMPPIGTAPNPFQQPNPRGGGGAPPPASGRSTPAPTGFGGGGLLGYGGSQGSGGLAAWQNAQQYMDPAEKARLGGVINSQGQFDPAQNTGSQFTAANITSVFNSLPEDRRGDFVNALMQVNGAAGVPANVGAMVQQALRDSMGKSAHDSWYAGVQNKQGSNIMSTAGLPSWLTALIK